MLECKKIKISQSISVILYVIVCYFLSNKFPTMISAGLILTMLILLDIKIKNKPAIVILAIFSNSYIAIQGTIVYVLLMDIIDKKCIAHKNKILNGYLIICIIASIIGFSGKQTIIAAILYTGTTIITFYTYFIFKKVDRKEIINLYHKLCLGQIVIVLLQVVPEFWNGTFHPDSVKGNFSSCIILVVVLFINVITLIIEQKENMKKKVIEVIIYLAIILLADAKIVFAILILATISTVILYKVRSMKQIKIICLVVILSIMGIGIFNKQISYKIRSTSLINYIENDSVNLKYKAFKYAFEDIKGIENITGIGIGQFGSKAANALAYDEMYKGSESLTLPEVIKPQTHEIYKPIARLSTEEYYNIISYYSGILSYPQSSVVTIKGETGYIGLIYIYAFIIMYISYILRKKRKDIFGFLAILMLIFLAIAMIFDNFLDMNVIMIVIFLCMALVKKEETKDTKINLTYVLSELKIGGAEKLVEVLIENSNRNKFEISLIILGNKEENELYYNLKKLGIKIYFCDKKGKDFIKTSKKVSMYIKENKSDIVHIHTSIIHLVTYGLIKNDVKGRVYTVHSIPSYDSPGMKKWIYAGIFKVLKFDVVAISKSIEDASRKYFNFKNINTINNCIDVEKFQSNRKIENRDPSKILHVGRFIDVKNQKMLIEVAKDIKNTDYQITFVGDGETLDENKKKAKDYKLEEKIKFLGKKDNIKQIMDEHSIFVLCSDIEGAPISILEAMANGMAIVATDVGGVKDFVKDGKNGYIVEKGNKEKLKEIILELINEPYKIIRLSEEAKKEAKKYSIRGCVEKHEEFYEKIIRE